MPPWEILSPIIIVSWAIFIIVLERLFPYDKGQKLLREGFLQSRRLGNLRLWSIDPNSPDARRIGATLRFATAPLEALASGLATLHQVRVALVFGSFASATDRPDSDIDVFVVGGVNWNKIAELGQTVERDLGRPTNFVIWTDDDFSHGATGSAGLGAGLAPSARWAGVSDPGSSSSASGSAGGGTGGRGSDFRGVSVDSPGRYVSRRLAGVSMRRTKAWSRSMSKIRIPAPPNSR